MSSHTTMTAHRRGRASEPEVRVGSFSNGIAYDVIGTGPITVVFLPGGPGIVRMAWNRVRRTLLQPLAAGGCTVWRLTRRRGMPAGHTLADVADDVAQVIDEAFGGHVGAVVGLSMGGMIAQFLAARHPDVMDRVVLLSAAATPTPATVARARSQGLALGNGHYTEACAAFFEDVLPGDRLRFVRRLLGLPMGRMLARSGNNPPDVLVETAALMDVDRPMESGSRHAKARRSSVFPLPEGPSTTTRSPDATSKLTSRHSIRPATCRDAWWIVSSSTTPRASRSSIPRLEHHIDLRYRSTILPVWPKQIDRGCSIQAKGRR